MCAVYCVFDIDCEVKQELLVQVAGVFSTLSIVCILFTYTQIRSELRKDINLSFVPCSVAMITCLSPYRWTNS